MKFIDKVFNFFGVNYKQADTYKDKDGRGLLERFNRVIGSDIDDNIIPFMDDILKNIYMPKTILEKLIPDMEETLGVDVYIGEDLRRVLLQNITKYYQVKGTTKGYKKMFSLLGLGATIVVNTDDDTGTFDDGGFFDDGGTFDTFVIANGCNSCIFYSIELTAVWITEVTQEMYDAVYEIVTFNEPINASLGSITINGSPFVVGVLVGDYNNDYNNDYN